MSRAARWGLVGAAALAGSLLAASLGLATVRAASARAFASSSPGDRAVALALLRVQHPLVFWGLLASVAAGLALPAAAALWLARRQAEPMRALASAAKRAADGDLGADLPVPDDGDAGDLAASVNRMRRALLGKVGEVEEERRLILSLVRGMVEGLVWIGPGRRILLANDAFRKIFGLSHPPEGMLLAEVVRHPDLIQEIDAALTEGRGTSEAAIEMPGTGRSFQVRVAPLEGREPGRPGGALVLFFDVTRLEALERVRRDFVANVSHELRTPLTSIKAFVETLADDGLENRERALEFLGIVRKHADRMAALIDDLTDLSLIETGAVALRLEDVDAAKLAAEVAGQLGHKAKEAGVTLSVELPAPFPIRADRHRFEQILVNLVDNGIKFNRPGGSVRIAGRAENGRRCLMVEDTGVGIPSDSLDKVFNRFYRVDKARSREAGGTGLGLAIVRHLMRLHGGLVRLDSEVGRGSRFTLEFPSPAP